MTGLTNYITECEWSDIFLTWFVLIDDAYRAVCTTTLNGRIRASGPEPALHDAEVITIAVIIETMFRGDEELGLAFVRQYHLDMFPRLVENSRFNRRRRDLWQLTEAVRKQLTSELINPQDAVRLVDSAPIPICTYTRSNQCSTMLSASTRKEHCGVMVSRRAKLYGVRVHLTTTTDQVVDQWLLAPASYTDGKVAAVLLEEESGLWVLGDNAFHNPTSADWLEERRNITLVGMPRRDTKTGWRAEWSGELRRELNRLRRRVESALSVLCTVFNLERPGSRSLSGLVTRTATRLLAYNLSFLVSPILQPSPN